MSSVYSSSGKTKSKHTRSAIQAFGEWYLNMAFVLVRQRGQIFLIGGERRSENRRSSWVVKPFTVTGCGKLMRLFITLASGCC